MVVQEFIEWEQFVRCLCLGQEDILAMRYDPRERKYHVDDGYLAPALQRRVVGDSRKLMRALGYDMNSIEWAIRGRHALRHRLHEPGAGHGHQLAVADYFEWVVKHMAGWRSGWRQPRPPPGRATGRRCSGAGPRPAGRSGHERHG